LCDVLCQDGYTYSFYFCNQPPPAHYVSQGFSPLHSWVLFMFNQLKHKYHIVQLDNLFMSANLCHGAFHGKNKVKIHGVTRNVSHEIPNSVRQEEETTPKAADLKQGAVKAVVLEGDADCPSLLAFSIYDTKPVHFLLMACTSIKWRKMEKLVYNKMSNQKVRMKFLRSGLIDDYNNGMNKVVLLV